MDNGAAGGDGYGVYSIRELQNTAEISAKCRKANGPIFITDDGGNDMVIMSAEVYRRMRIDHIYAKLMEAEEDIRNGRVSDAQESLARMRIRYGV